MNSYQNNRAPLRFSNDSESEPLPPEHLILIAQELRHLIMNNADALSRTEMSEGGEHRTLLAIAKKELKLRKLRSQYLPQEFFGDAAWAMLLDIYVSEHEGKQLSTTSVCHGSLSPPTTALRWIDVLAHNGLVDRQPGVADKRVKYVSLTAKGRNAVAAILRSRF